MVKDFKYIIKRILIGVGIALLLGFVRKSFVMQVYAQDLTFTSASICSNGYGCTTVTSMSQSLRQSYGNVLSVEFANNFSLINGHTYSFNYYTTIYAPNGLTVPQTPTLTLYYGNNQSLIATADRYDNLSVTYIGNYRYGVSWTFELDVLGNNFNKANFTTYLNTSYTSDYYRVGCDQILLSITDITSSGGGSSSNQDIINNQNSNTQNIINNNNSNTQNIINNNNNNTENIINSQNENTQKEIDSQMVCNFIDKDDISVDDKYLTSTGAVTGASSYGITDYIKINQNSKINVVEAQSSTGASYCFYTVNKTVISCSVLSTLSSGTVLTVPNNAAYFRSSILYNTNKPQYNICVSGNQALQDSLTDDTGVNNSELSDLFDDISDSSNSPVSDLLTLPITLLQAYLTGFQSNCATITLGTLYGTTLSLPCIDIPHYIGNSLWSVIDSLFCLYMIYNIAMMCISIYESITSLDDSMQLLYTPQHANSRVARNGGTYNG